MKIISLSESGHRREYAALLLSELRSLGIDAEVCSSVEPFEASPLLFSVIEDHPAEFAVVALVRSMMGRRTVGFLFRPGQCFTKGSLRHAVKRSVFRVISRLPFTQVLTLLPYELDPRFSAVSTGWIFDPQLWDLGTLGRRTRPASELQDRIRAAANGRQILVSLGRQNRDKGFDFLADVVSAPTFDHDRMLVVAAGGVEAGSSASAKAFVGAGGLLVDRLLSDDEFLGLYFEADLVWSCYACDYDQASGIFGRAVQLGVPAVVRAGSYLVRLAQLVDHPILAVGFEDPREAARSVSDGSARPRRPGDATSRVATMRQVSLDSLVSALAAKSVAATRPSSGP